MSSIIKAAELSESGDSPAARGASPWARRALERVRREAEQIVITAQQQAAEIARQSEASGRQAGLAAAEQLAQEQLHAQLATLLPALRQAVDDIAEARQAWLAHWEKTAVHLAAAIAARVIRRELAHTPEIPLKLVKEALELAAGAADVRLRLNPEDFAALGDQVERLAAEMFRLGEVQIVSDPQITRGGCRVDTRFGTIDEQFEAQLARIEQELT